MDRSIQQCARHLLAPLALSVALVGCAKNDECDYSAADDRAVRDAVQNYVKAWLANDADKVMATLTDDIVLQPHHGDEPVVGAQDVRDWWFPEGPPAPITRFSNTTEKTEGCGSLAYAWGRFDVAWTYEGASYSNAGNSLSVVEHTSNGWRIAHQIWNDPVARVTTVAP